MPSFEPTNDTFLIRAEVQTSPGLEADLFGTLDLFGRAQGPQHDEAQLDLEEDISLAVSEVFPDPNIRIWYSRGTLIVWVLVTVSAGIIGNAAYDMVRHVGQRVRDALGNWIARRFGGPAVADFEVQVEEFFWTGRAAAATPRAPVVSGGWSPNFAGWLVAVLAVAAQAALIFALVWLLVSRVPI